MGLNHRKPLHETLPKTYCKLEMTRKKQEDGTPYPPCQFMSKVDDPLFMSEDDDPFADSVNASISTVKSVWKM
ncbi:hypothetical protein V2J09_023025 [Rumex salicifolius]